MYARQRPTAYMMPSNNKDIHIAAIQLLAAVDGLKRHSSPEDEGFHPPGIDDYPEWLDAWGRFEVAIVELNETCDS